MRRYDLAVIKEWLEYLKTPSTQLAKSKGFLHQSVALKFRAERLKGPWAGHLQACADLLAELNANQKSILILGSGHLLETPEHLLKSFSKVALIDMLHPVEVRKTAQKNDWQLYDLDLSGLWREKDPQQLQQVAKDFDYVVSANLLSQIPWSWAHSQAQLNEQHLLTTISQLLNVHWQLLESLRKPTLIWSDVEEIHLSKLNEVVAQGDTLPGLMTPKIYKEWIWNFAPVPEIHTDLSIQLRMNAFKLNF